MPTFNAFDPGNDSPDSLASAIFTTTAGASLVPASATANSGLYAGVSDAEEPSSIAFYDGSLAQLGLGAGIMLTTGDPTPPDSNTDDNYGDDTRPEHPDADLQATVDLAFPDVETVRDVSSLQFDVNITDPAITGLRFNLVFASDEYSISNNETIDIAAVYVNGQNYALFDGSGLQPLGASLVNSQAGNFIDNEQGVVPLEYDGLTVRLQVTAPVHAGLNTIKIAIADTYDANVDSALFISGVQPVAYTGFGLARQVPLAGTNNVIDAQGNQVYLGNALANAITLVGGRDVVDGGAGIDDLAIGYALDDYTWDGVHLNLFGAGGTASQAVNVERVEYGPLLIGLDTSAGGNVYGVAALFQAAFNTSILAPVAQAPGILSAGAVISEWVNYADAQAAAGGDLGDVAQAIINAYAGTAGNESIIALLYQNIFGVAASEGEIDFIASYVGTQAFPTIGDLFAYAALLPENTSELAAAGVTGSLVLLDPAYF